MNIMTDGKARYVNQHSNSSDERVIAKALLDFFKGFSQGRLAPQEEFDRARAYAELLSKYSLRAVRIALERIGRRGEAFVPSASQIAAECERVAVEYPITDMRAPLLIRGPVNQPDAQPADPERMKAEFAKLLGELRASSDPLVKRQAKPMSEITKTEAQAALDRMAAEGPWAPKLSAAARATIREATNPIETEEQLKDCLR